MLFDVSIAQICGKGRWGFLISEESQKDSLKFTIEESQSLQKDQIINGLQVIKITKIQWSSERVGSCQIIFLDLPERRGVFWGGKSEIVSIAIYLFYKTQ